MSAVWQIVVWLHSREVVSCIILAVSVYHFFVSDMDSNFLWKRQEWELLPSAGHPLTPQLYIEVDRWWQVHTYTVLSQNTIWQPGHLNRLLKLYWVNLRVSYFIWIKIFLTKLKILVLRETNNQKKKGMYSILWKQE